MLGKPETFIASTKSCIKSLLDINLSAYPICFSNLTNFLVLDRLEMSACNIYTIDRG